MNPRYISRSIEPVLLKAAKEFPAVVLTGPRQSGKTTTLKRLFGDKTRYVSLEPPDIRAAAVSDPRGFLEMYSSPVILDEIQYAPDLLPYIKEKVDSSRDKTGQYILTGSQNLLLIQQVTESLAGRTVMLRLMPLSQRETVSRPDAPLPWESGYDRSQRQPVSIKNLWNGFLRGGYPELVVSSNRDIALWHASYVQTYLERDVRSLRQVGDLTQFQTFLRALAARSAQLLQLTDLSRDLGVAVNTIKAWLSILEATYQIIILRPYFGNTGKRLVKTPKVYFTDVGTLCYLAGLRDPEHAALGPMGGAIFETTVLSELFKALLHRGISPQIYFWRTSSGAEVDFVIEVEGKLIPIEAKLSATPRPTMAKNLRRFRSDYRDRCEEGYLVHPGEICLPLGDEITALPFANL